ncbi:MAG: major facilitator superfamily 1 [Myxococcales bacterium]|nr:major facilitator superfamily 1 [Myxococcales bacterium]
MTGHVHASQRVRSWTNQIATALSHVGKNPRLAWIVGYSAVVFVLLRATIYLYQPYLEERGLGPVAIGVLFAGVYGQADVMLVCGAVGILGLALLAVARIRVRAEAPAVPLGTDGSGRA